MRTLSEIICQCAALTTLICVVCTLYKLSELVSSFITALIRVHCKQSILFRTPGSHTLITVCSTVRPGHQLALIW